MPQLPLLLDTLVDHVGDRLRKSSFTWVRDEPTADDLRHIQEEAKEGDRFDVLRCKSTMLQEYKEGKAVLHCRRGPYAKVLILANPTLSIPWGLWAKIFQAFGPPQRPHKLWRVVWFASLQKREFPLLEHSSPVKVGPEHVNGGYTMSCDPSAVVIYRYEEASRVLIHELLHAACLDNPHDDEPIREALTETWAELFLIAIQSGGSKRKAGHLWTIQSQWIADQAAVLESAYKVTTPLDYPWRYTVGRREILSRFRIQLPPPSENPMMNLQGSLSFTAPPLTEA